MTYECSNCGYEGDVSSGPCPGCKLSSPLRRAGVEPHGEPSRTLWIGFRNADRLGVAPIRIAAVESNHWYSARSDIAAKLGGSPLDLECLDGRSREALALTRVPAVLVGFEAQGWFNGYCDSRGLER